MVALEDPGYVLALVLHILFAMVAVGAVTVTDYLHIIGLKSKRLERKLFVVYDHLARMIQFSIAGIIGSGIGLLFYRPELLSQSLFQLKMGLFGIVLVNGLFLHKKVYPQMIACVVKKTRECTDDLLFISSLTGSISVVTWYCILILAITKTLGFTPLQFLGWYFIAILIAFFIGFCMEIRMRRWKRTF